MKLENQTKLNHNLNKSFQSCWIVPHVTKILQNFLLNLVIFMTWTNILICFFLFQIFNLFDSNGDEKITKAEVVILPEKVSCFSFLFFFFFFFNLFFSNFTFESLPSYLLI